MKVRKLEELGSHVLFLADVVGLSVDQNKHDDRNMPDFSKIKPLCYIPGTKYYYGLTAPIHER